jgi:hypothetical protein
MTFSIKEHVQGMATFQFYRDGKLWYVCSATGFLFPVPVEDLGTAQALSTDKAIIFMKWIRKWAKEIEGAKEQQQDK